MSPSQPRVDRQGRGTAAAAATAADYFGRDGPSAACRRSPPADRALRVP